MPRQPRLDAPGILQHVMARGIERRLIFVDDPDRKDFLARFAQILEETQTHCYVYPVECDSLFNWGMGLGSQSFSSSGSYRTNHAQCRDEAAHDPICSILQSPPPPGDETASSKRLHKFFFVYFVTFVVQ